MPLTSIKANMTELKLENGIRVLFSYRTPVACMGNAYVAFKTDKFWSKTTSRHINQWVGSAIVELKPQEYFDNLIAGVK